MSKTINEMIMDIEALIMKGTGKALADMAVIVNGDNELYFDPSDECYSADYISDAIDIALNEDSTTDIILWHENAVAAGLIK